VGTPFRALGREAGRGLDCVGIVLEAAGRSGLHPIGDALDYGLLPRKGELTRRLRDNARLIEIDLGEFGDGDILALWMRDPEEATHLAVATGPDIVHARLEFGAVCLDPLRPRWIRRLHSAWRIGEAWLA